MIGLNELKFISLECHRTDDRSESADDSFDLTSEDEVYLRADHKQVWGVTRMKSGDLEDLSSVNPIKFEERIGIELWDKDAGYSSEDDQIGSLVIQKNLAGTGKITHEFRSKNARYTLIFKVK